MRSSGKIPTDVDSYLRAVPAEQRAALEKLRQTIRAAAPKAVETISYQVPTLKYHGMLVSFAAFRDHCSFFPGAGPVKAFADELSRFPTSKGTIRFTPDKPLPAALVKKIVKARVRENETRARLKGKL